MNISTVELGSGIGPLVPVMVGVVLFVGDVKGFNCGLAGGVVSMVRLWGSEGSERLPASSMVVAVTE